MNIWVVQHHTLDAAYKQLINGDHIQGAYANKQIAIGRCVNRFTDDIHVLKTIHNGVYTIWSQDISPTETILKLYDRMDKIIATKSIQQLQLII